MYQQINLYQPVFRHEKKVFSALTLLQLLGVILVVLIGVSGLLRWQLAQFDQDLGSLQRQHTALSTQIEQLEQAQAGADVAALDQQIATLEARNRMLDRLLAEIEAFQQPDGHFSQVLKDLAQIQVSGLWLTRIALNANGAVTLTGQARDPEQVPRYLEALAEQPRLGGTRLDQVTIERNAEAARQVGFSLSNLPDDGREAAAINDRQPLPPRFTRKAMAGEPRS